MDNETKNPCNLTAEEQDQLRSLLSSRSINLHGKKLTNGITNDNVTGFAPTTTDRIVKWKDGPNEIITDSHLSDLSANLVKGDILYASANDILNKLAIGTSQDQLRTSSGGIPEWFTPSAVAGTITTYSSSDVTIASNGVNSSSISNFMLKKIAFSNFAIAIFDIIVTWPSIRTAVATIALPASITPSINASSSCIVLPGAQGKSDNSLLGTTAEGFPAILIIDTTPKLILASVYGELFGNSTDASYVRVDRLTGQIVYVS